jgi:hypothetical protein
LALHGHGHPKDAEHRTYSLWASPAEKAARELRSKERRETGQPPSRVERHGNVTTIHLS